jgi:hypothetical protein
MYARPRKWRDAMRTAVARVAADAVAMCSAAALVQHGIVCGQSAASAPGAGASLDGKSGSSCWLADTFTHHARASCCQRLHLERALPISASSSATRLRSQHERSKPSRHRAASWPSRVLDRSAPDTPHAVLEQLRIITGQNCDSVI